MTDTIEGDLDELVDAAVSIAHEAGQLTLETFRKAPDVRTKRTDVDLVTQTDLDSESLIAARLTERFPDHGLLFEEGTEKAMNESDALWIVDPLDGTVNFAHGHPFYCISMALQLEGEIVVGVTYAPVLDVTWTARRSGGSFRNGSSLRVTTTQALESSFCASGFPYDRRTTEDNNAAEWCTMIRRAQALRRCGAAAIDLAMVADGTFDGFWEKRLKPWDLAAGTLLVNEAGGRVTDVAGMPVPPWPEVIVATNGLIHSELLDVLVSTASR